MSLFEVVTSEAAAIIVPLLIGIGGAGLLLAEIKIVLWWWDKMDKTP